MILHPKLGIIAYSSITCQLKFLATLLIYISLQLVLADGNQLLLEPPF